MWCAGYRAGLPHPTTLTSVGGFPQSPTVGRLRRYLLEGTTRGEDLSTLVLAAPQHFKPFEAGLLQLGDEAGGLEQALTLLAEYFQAEHRMVLDIKKKMSYPLMNAVAAIFIAPFPLLFYGRVTAYVLTATGGLVLALAAGGGLLHAVARWFGNRPKYVLGRLLRALALGVEAGLPLDRVVTLGVAAAGDPALSAHVARHSARARGSQSLAATFRGASLLPPAVFAAFEVADASGNYSGTLRKLADLYDG